MTILVTGSIGGIGRAVVERLAGDGNALRTLDRTARPPGQQAEHLPCDMRDIAAVRRAVDGVETVVHLAAISHDRYGSPEEVLAVNVLGTLNLLQACAEAGVRRF